MEDNHDEGWDDHEAICRKASAWRQKRGTDLKMKSQIRPWRITIQLLINVKGINVILHGLRPVPINRWTVLLYCSRWLGIRFSHNACTFTFRQSEGTYIICHYEFNNTNKDKLVIISVLLFVFHIWVLLHHLSNLRRSFPSWPSSRIHYIRRDIMSLRTKDFYI